MKKLNNKGFSLVELIVVIAIMAILAVTLAPRLTQYVEKSRKASDQEAVNTIFTAAKLANLEAPLADEDNFELVGTLYTVNVKDWTIAKYTVAEPYEKLPQKFFDTMFEILADFKLKSSEADTDTSITVAKGADGKLSVTLQYDSEVDVTDNPSTGYIVSE